MKLSSPAVLGLMPYISTWGSGQALALRFQPSARTDATASRRNRDVGSLPPDRNAGSRHRPPTQRKRCAYGSSTRKPIFAGIVSSIAKSLQSWKVAFPDPSISPTYYAKTPVPGRHGRGCPTERLDQSFLSRHPGGGQSHGVPRVCGLSRPIPRILTRHQISLRGCYSPSVAYFFLPHLFIPLPGGPEPEGCDRQRRWFRRDADCRPSLKPPRICWARLKGGMNPSILPDGTQSRKLTFTWFHEEDLLTTAALTAGCSYTFESFNITQNLLGTFILHLRPH